MSEDEPGQATGQPGEAPARARQLETPAALALADLAAIFEELKTVLGCCEQLMAELAKGEHANRFTVDALWTAALIAYQRCFATGERGMQLTEQDVTDLGLEGEVLEWHAMLGQMCELYTDVQANPREAFTVGITEDAASGEPSGVAIMSASPAGLDDVTIRQTGRIAYELSSTVDRKIAAQQEKVLGAAQQLSPAEREKLAVVEIAGLG